LGEIGGQHQVRLLILLIMGSLLLFWVAWVEALVMALIGRLDKLLGETGVHLGVKLIARKRLESKTFWSHLFCNRIVLLLAYSFCKYMRLVYL